MKEAGLLELNLENEQATVALGAEIANLLSDTSGVIFLAGTLGAGKTTLTRGILQALGHSGAVKSPTYTLVEPYELPSGIVYHFDLYRLGDPEELEYMGVRDYFSQGRLCIVEWPQKGAGVLREPDLAIELKVSSPRRTALVQACSPRGQSVVDGLQQERS